jgi:arylsulfatase A
MYEGGYRVPGIAVWPKTIKPNQVSRIPVGAIDFFPTICAVAQIDLPTDRVYDGTNLLPLFRNENLNRSKPLFWYYINALGEPRVSMRDGDWKLVATLRGNPRPQRGPGAAHSAEWLAGIKAASLDRFELYNLADDHREQTDLATKEPQRLAEMKRKMQSLFDDVRRDAPLWKMEN